MAHFSGVFRGSSKVQDHLGRAPRKAEVGTWSRFSGDHANIEEHIADQAPLLYGDDISLPPLREILLERASASKDPRELLLILKTAGTDDDVISAVIARAQGLDYPELTEAVDAAFLKLFDKLICADDDKPRASRNVVRAETDSNNHRLCTMIRKHGDDPAILRAIARNPHVRRHGDVMTDLVSAAEAYEAKTHIDPRVLAEFFKQRFSHTP